MRPHRWLTVLALPLLATAAADCRLIAGYEELELLATPPSGGSGGTAAGGGVAGAGAEGGSGGTGGTGPQVTITSLTATPARVIGSREVLLEWVVELADACQFDQGLGNAAPYWGSLLVTPANTTTYTLSCTGAGAPTSQAATVTVLGVTMAGGDATTCALSGQSVLKCFGHNDRGQLGAGDTDNRGDGAGEMGDALQGIDVGQGHTVLQVAVGHHHVCALLDDNKVKCWGANDRGQLGLDDSDDRGGAPDQMGDALPWLLVGGTDKLALGGDHSCALLLNQSVKCWGANDEGQLGLGDTDDRGTAAASVQDIDPIALGTGRTAKAIAAGRAHSCALLDDDTVKCWGGNAYGQLGLGHSNALGDEPGEMGDALLPIALGTDRTPVALAGAGDHSCVLLDDDSIKCWGRNTDGQLGTGDDINYGAAAGTMGDALPAVDLGTGRHAKAIGVGGFHSCAITDTNLVKCWGRNADGQLGIGSLESQGTEVADMGDALAAVNLGAQRTVKSIALGTTHTCAVMDDGTVRCWGGNDQGQLGLGDQAARGVNAGQMGESLSLVDLTP